MIYVCVPVHNEARTAGLVLWKVRQVFTAFPREYQLLVLDDASTDDTGEVLASYAKVLPMTVVTHRERRGYAASLEELLRLALRSEERRVGKECRSRWSAAHYKKKERYRV